MTSHRADLPEKATINPGLRFRFYNRILNRAKDRVRINWGIVLILVILIAATAAIAYGVEAIVDSLN